MEALFYITALAYTMIVLVPGYLLMRVFGFDRTWSVLLGPLPGIGMLTLLGQVYASLDVHATPLLMLGPPVVILAICYLLVSRTQERAEVPEVAWWIPLLYVAIGLGLGYYFFVGRLITSDQVIQAFDLTQAVDLIRTFANSGHFTSVGVDYYLDDAAINPAPGTSFYPATWHMLCALAVQLTGASVPTAINASQLSSLGVLFPLGIAATIAAIFDGDTRHLVAGALSCLAFVIFPWVFLIFGPIYPNMAAFAVMPCVFAIFILMTSDEGSRRQRLSLLVSFVLAGIGLGSMHPGGIFASVIFLAPWCTYRIWVLARARWGGRVIPLAAAAAFVAFVCAVWYGCFLAPPFRPIVVHSWLYFTKEWQELVNILTLSYIYGYWFEFAAQIPLAIAVIVGAVWALHHREHAWLVAAYIIICYIAFVCATEETRYKHILAGFWYCDHIRIAGICCILAIPLATMGLVWAYEQVLHLVGLYNGRTGTTTNAVKVAIVCSLAFIVANFLPEFNMPGSYFDVILNEGLNDDPPEEVLETYSEAKMRVVGRKYHSVHTPFGDYRTAFTRKTVSENPISEQEKAFMKEVAEVVGSDALVINNPEDGSFLGYGFENIRCYYRYFVRSGREETATSELIRSELVNYATSPEVHAAVDELGAEYVMLLSEKDSETSFINLRGNYSETAYAGISSITPETPGFELLLQSEDLYLYRITRDQ